MSKSLVHLMIILGVPFIVNIFFLTKEYYYQKIRNKITRMPFFLDICEDRNYNSIISLCGAYSPPFCPYSLDWNIWKKKIKAPLICSCGTCETQLEPKTLLGPTIHILKSFDHKCHFELCPSSQTHRDNRSVSENYYVSSRKQCHKNKWRFPFNKFLYFIF